MIKRQLTAFFLLICLTGFAAAENFYEAYPESERLIIADAYLAVSEQYKEMGETDKAAAFRRMALETYPEIEAARQAGTLASPEQASPEPAPTIAAAPQRPSGREPSAVRYYFSKLLRGIFAENIQDVMSLISTRLYLPGFEQGIARREVEDFLTEAFAAYPLESTDPSEIYSFNRYFIKKEGTAWTVKVNLTAEGIRVMQRELGLPGEAHIFYFREYREGWRLIALSGE